jgi:hypothetical protein
MTDYDERFKHIQYSKGIRFTDPEMESELARMWQESWEAHSREMKHIMDHMFTNEPCTPECPQYLQLEEGQVSLPQKHVLATEPEWFDPDYCEWCGQPIDREDDQEE